MQLRRTQSVRARGGGGDDGGRPSGRTAGEPLHGEHRRDFYDGMRLGQHWRVRAAIEERGLEFSRITVLDALLKL